MPSWRTSTSGSKERRHHRLEGRLVDRIVCIGLERQVDRVADALSLAYLLHEAGAGEEAVASLVARDGEHPRVAVEGELHAVAVMGVDVHVGDLQVPPPELHDGKHGVVDVAEARSAIGHRMVQSAREMEDALDLVVEDQPGGQDGTARYEFRRFPEPGEDRIVAGA